jgi:muramoyltetrapeptide carboxypeptidase LdcA involved in peptidoglycan recycling
MNKKIGIIAPSLPLVDVCDVASAEARLSDYNIEVEYYINAEKIDAFVSAQNSDVDLIMAVRGGFNCVELLPQIDFSEVKKSLCGYSDITVLLNALLAKTGKIQFLGPNLKALCTDVDDYTIKNFISVALMNERVMYKPSKTYLDLHVSNTESFVNSGIKVVNSGVAEGHLVGGNLCSQIMLAGTEYYPVYDNMIVVAEEDDLCGSHTVDMFLRNLWALFNYNFAKNIKGLIIGRFMRNSNVDVEAFVQKLQSFDPLKKIPVVVGFDTGHTLPQMTLPLGQKVIIDTESLSFLR